MEDLKELANNSNISVIGVIDENDGFEDKSMYYSSLKEPTASLTDESRTNDQNDKTQWDAKLVNNRPVRTPIASGKNNMLEKQNARAYASNE
jgi:hypothetical protein